MSNWDTLNTDNPVLFPKVNIAGVMKKTIDFTNVTPNWWDSYLLSIKNGWLDDQNAGGKKLLNLGLISAPGQPTAMARNRAGQTIPNAVYTTVNFEVEDFVAGGIHQLVSGIIGPGVIYSDPTRFLARNSGIFLFGGALAFAFNATGERFIRFLHSSGAVLGGGGGPVSLTNITIATGYGIAKMIAGEYLQIQGYQASGGPLAIGGAGSFTYGFMHQIA